MRRRCAMAALVLLLAGCQHRPWAALERCRGVIPADSRQAVVVARAGDGPSGVTVGLFRRAGDGWRRDGAPFPAVAGRAGLAPFGEKREGDGRTPSGVFPLERGFGYEPLPAARLPYTVLTPELIWIDDVRSPSYNRLVTRPEGAGLSFETMRRDDGLYRYGVVVEYNTRETVPGAGSAIFFHVWRGPGSTTAGCVAAAEPDLVRLLGWLDPAQRPVTVLGDACR